MSHHKALSLHGTWNLALDRDDVGVEQRWFDRKLPGLDTIELPGSLQGAGFGDQPGPDTDWTGRVIDKSYFVQERYAPYRNADNFKIPFWLTPDKVYTGAAWYQRRVQLDAGRHEIFLERCHWISRVWMNSKELGDGRSLSTPHVYRIELDQPSEIRLTVLIDNRMVVDLGPNSHSMSDHTQGNWNGMIGEMSVRPLDSVSLEKIEVYPSIDENLARVRFRVDDHSGASGAGELSLRAQIKGGEDTAPITFAQKMSWQAGDVLEAELPMGSNVHWWSEHTPSLYHLCLELFTNHGQVALAETDFGMVQAKTRHTHITINDSPIFLRGTLDCCAFPKTGHPPMDIESWRRILATVKGHGLNHVRFHSWCPPEAAFQAGDELGLMFQVECASWANSSTALGIGEPVDEWLYEEGHRIVETYGNHPCFILMAYGNEPAGPGTEDGQIYLSKWVHYWKQHDPRRLHTGGAGWPRIPENDFHNLPAPRIQGWGQGLASIINGKPPSSAYNWRDIIADFGDQPTVSHEVGQWCAYPNFEEIEKYDGFMKATNFEIFRDFLEAKGMGFQSHDFLMASGKLQAQCYKADIEAALRTEGFGGFQLLGLNDFPGQGSAMVGVLDAFWDEKGYIKPHEFKEFASDSVPLVALERHIFEVGDTLEAPLHWAHFGANNHDDFRAVWRLREKNGRTLNSGSLVASCLEKGKLQYLGVVRHEFKEIDEPKALVLEVEGEDSTSCNRWSIFVYPKSPPVVSEDGIIVTSRLTEEILEELQSGARVWFQANPKSVETKVELGYSSIFWNTAWTQGQAPHTMGILCDPDHPALEHFPTDDHSDWQWWSVLRHAKTLELSSLGWAAPSIVQIVPDWFHPQHLSLVFEAKVGKGQLLMSSIDFTGKLDPVRRQLHHSLMAYWASGKAHPTQECTADGLGVLLVNP